MMSAIPKKLRSYVEAIKSLTIAENRDINTTGMLIETLSNAVDSKLFSNYQNSLLQLSRIIPEEYLEIQRERIPKNLHQIHKSLSKLEKLSTKSSDLQGELTILQGTLTSTEYLEVKLLEAKEKYEQNTIEIIQSN